MSTTYALNSRPFILRDTPQRIDFHIRTGDYFLSLATLLGFIEETLACSEETTEIAQQRKLARELRNDLRYVQANYKIVPRLLGDVETIQPKGNLLGRSSHT